MAKSDLQAAGIGLLCLAFLVGQSGAFEFTVGGSNNGWSVPSDPNVNVLNQWAERNRFRITDSIVFAYAPGDDSVLYVNQDDYKSCNTTSPIAKYVDGHTVFKFNHSGPFYFISGNKDKCLKNEKLVVIVLADRSQKGVAPSPPPSESTEASPPAPSPSVEPSPAPSGTEGTSPPSPSPSAEQTPSPSPSETSGSNPTTAPAPAEAEAPSSKEPSPNNAGAVMESLASSLGALIASSFFLAP
ncbi:hypothetical protein MLD38_022055 [Melastoma candidum]|uniref:Uncharacterized protein n=1 Tax=Melastoma candidum TaxID=119954 RepID=A0ACB9QH79_9MYRT|nr:hypothetical protein MLD38_022055 [Melastoma candidum]